MANTQAPSWYKLVGTADNGNTIELGTGSATGASTGIVTIQFVPDGSWNGSFGVVARTAGAAAAALTAAQNPFIAYPYRKLNVAGVASDFTAALAAITTTGIIQIPTNGMSIGLTVAWVAGTCGLLISRMDGSVAL